MAYFKGRFSTRGLWVLFTSIAFPIHVWAIIMFFFDYDWIAQRTNAWDAVGVGAYALLIALVESTAVFLVTLVLSFLLPKRWTETQRTVLLGLLAFVVFLWGVLGQLYFLPDTRLPGILARFLEGSRHPFRITAGIFLLITGIMVVLPVYGVMCSRQFTASMNSIFERVAVLTSAYLVIDIAALVLVIGRNL